MNTAHISRYRLARLTAWLVSAVMLSHAYVWAGTEQSQAVLGNDEETFVFTGRCANDAPYRLFSYQKNVSGLSQSFYDYEGPNGKGTVQTETTPKVMAARVCRKWAEIINTNYWE